MSIKVLIPIADGTEEIEAVTAIDLFRRAEFQVTVAGDKEQIICSRGVILAPDCLIADIDGEFDLIYLPGGAVGINNLMINKDLPEILQNHLFDKGNIAAICAAPLLLHKHNLLENDAHITSHPSVSDSLKKYNYSQDAIAEHNNFFTSRGAGTAMEFVLFLIEKFASKVISENIANSILFERK